MGRAGAGVLAASPLPIPPSVLDFRLFYFGPRVLVVACKISHWWIVSRTGCGSQFWERSSVVMVCGAWLPWDLWDLMDFPGGMLRESACRAVDAVRR